MPPDQISGSSPFPEPFFAALGGESTGQRFCLWHAPGKTPPRGLVVHVHAFAEEMNKSRRMCALQARALAAEGMAVLQFDLLGCGDSGGDFGIASWGHWLADVDAACDMAMRRLKLIHGPDAPPLQLWLWGHRAGCLLAAATAARRTESWHLLLWQPTISGKTVLQQFLRLETIGAALGKAGIAERPRAATLLAAGNHAEVAGYRLAPALTQGLEAARLEPPASAASVVWVDLAAQPDAHPSPAVQTQLQAWTEAGWKANHFHADGPSFWRTTEIEDAPALVETTTRALRSALATADVDRRQVVAA